MRLFHRKLSVELVLGVYFLSDHVLLVMLYPTAAHQWICAWHAFVDLVLGIYFMVRGLSNTFTKPR